MSSNPFVVVEPDFLMKLDTTIVVFTAVIVVLLKTISLSLWPKTLHTIARIISVLAVAIILINISYVYAQGETPAPAPIIIPTNPQNPVVILPANRVGVIDWTSIIYLLVPAIITMIFAFSGWIKARTSVILNQATSEQVKQVSAQVAVTAAKVDKVAAQGDGQHTDLVNKLNQQTADILSVSKDNAIMKEKIANQAHLDDNKT